MLRVIGCISLLLFTLPLCANDPPDKEEVKPIDVRITRTKDRDVTISVSGAKCYAWDFTISKFQRKGYWSVVVTFIEFDHSTHTGGRISEARSVTLKNVLCDVQKRGAKTLLRAPDVPYVLSEGPEAEPGENLYLEGTFTWKEADGDVHFFHEKGTGRVWKSVSPEKKKK